MINIAQFRPARHVSNLHNLVVPGYAGYEGGVVALTCYSSANTMFTPGGSTPAQNRDAFSGALGRITTGKPEHAFVRSEECRRVFSGQGMSDDIISVLAAVVRYESQFRAVPALRSFFAQADYLQAMLDAGCIGMDCIGFVGTYLAAAGVTNGYEGRRPLDYSAYFPFATSLADVHENSIVMLTNGMHIQIIDRITSRQANSVTVELCQSSTGGPQVNMGVTISAAGGSFLPVDDFRAKMDAARLHGTYDAAFESQWGGSGDKNNAYETYLRRTLTVRGENFGWHGGEIFHLGAGYDAGVFPANPVSGSVYVGTMRGDLTVRAPGAP